ncbi:Adenine phosphoribosyltransferase [Paramyrothecium foliicola]|nr:Adenine phosphoribosyltransferase [Paramyrothecium foliicola]
MATLDSLKKTLREEVTSMVSSTKEKLTDTQYSAGFDILVRGSRKLTYQAFIFPELQQLLAPLIDSHGPISVLEIGPGPRSVLGFMPSQIKQAIKLYRAFEPNSLFASELETWLCPTMGEERPLPSLESPPRIDKISFVPGRITDNQKYDVVLFCHSMYGMEAKHKSITYALSLLAEQPESGVVIVFHRDVNLHLDGLVCQSSASFPDGMLLVPDDDAALDAFTRFIAGFAIQDHLEDNLIRAQWRRLCRGLARREKAYPNKLLFSSPNVMLTFTRHATALAELKVQVPLAKTPWTVKNWEARLHHTASVVRPANIHSVQQCVKWAISHKTNFTVVGGGHSGHCLWPNVVAIDMGAFNRVHIIHPQINGTAQQPNASPTPLLVAEAGCKTGDIVSKAMAAGLAIPLGSRPSVGAGLWLQGGIGHLARLHGLTCDAIVGAVIVKADFAEVCCVGNVPEQHRPAGCVRPRNEDDLLWALQGAGVNFGIVISVTFRTFAAPMYKVRNWIVPLSERNEARRQLDHFDEAIAATLPRSASVDAYLFCDNDQLHLGVTLLESSINPAKLGAPTTALSSVERILGPGECSKVVNSFELFDTEMYMSKMHGGHGGGKTSSFKRCLFLKAIGRADVAGVLMTALQNRPTPLCYMHLLHGGGAVRDVAAHDSAFGCRDWDFACVVTGVWPRSQDGTEVARAVVDWVYDTAQKLLPLSRGVYSADLGPDPRDAMFATRAFGPNRLRLAHLKRALDPYNVLANTCPLLEPPTKLKLVILVTGQSGVGKDHCATIWASVFNTHTQQSFETKVDSISNATKRMFAAATGADLQRLFTDRTYKEEHRQALTEFFHDQVRARPKLPEENFLALVHDALDVDVLLITGMREAAPVAALSHLIAGIRLFEVNVQASEAVRRERRGCNTHSNNDQAKTKGNSTQSSSFALKYCPDLIFENTTAENKNAEAFANRYLLPLMHHDLQRLADMVRSVPNFPRPGIDFRHVLGISQQKGGLTLCTSLLQSHFTGDWPSIDAIVSCEAGGFIFASALAGRVNLPLVLIREAGKLPPPTHSLIKFSSHISSPASDRPEEKKIEMDRHAVYPSSSVVIVDDVLATGKTLCAVLQLLEKAGVKPENMSIMVVAEFPLHGGRQLLRELGFGKVGVRSLLVFGGA